MPVQDGVQQDKVFVELFLQELYRGTYMLSNKSWQSSAYGIGLPTLQTLQ